MKVNDLVILEAKKEKLELKPLKFGLNKLEPVMSKETLDLHYNHLTRAYFKKYDETGDLFQKAGAVLHNMWWEQLMPPKNNNKPTGEILEFIEKNFKNFKDFSAKFEEKALAIHGSGWTYLSTSGDVKIIPNHEIKKDILLILDNWEHSFILDEGSDKKKYIKEFWKIIDWDFINQRLVS